MRLGYVPPSSPQLDGLKCCLNFEQRPHIPRSHRSRLSRDLPREIQILGDKRRQEEGVASNRFLHAERSLPPASLLTCSSTPPHALLKQACS